MAYRRSLTTSARLIARQPFSPVICCTHHDDDSKKSPSYEKVNMTFLQSRSYSNKATTLQRFHGGRMSFAVPKQSQLGLLVGRNMSARNMSTVTVNGEKLGRMAEIGRTIDQWTDETAGFVSNQAAAVSEVAGAAWDLSTNPVADVEYVIDGIHVYTGLNWWATILLTNIVIGTLAKPALVSYSNAMDQIIDWWNDKGVKGNDRMQGVEGQGEMLTRLKEQGLRLYNKRSVPQLIWTPMKGFLVGTVFVSQHLAIKNMVEKVPSFHTGGIAWFTDLTTTDSSCILPYLTAFSFWCLVEKPMLKLLKVDPKNAVMKKFLFLSSSAFIVPFLATCPNAILCDLITFNSIFYVPYLYGPIKKLMNRPIVETAPPSESSSMPSATDGSSSKSWGSAAKSKKQRENPPKSTGGSSSKSEQQRTGADSNVGYQITRLDPVRVPEPEPFSSSNPRHTEDEYWSFPSIK